MGCPKNRMDVPIYKNHFPTPVPFDIQGNAPFIYHKEHSFPTRHVHDVIFIIRNPREVLPNFCKYGYDAKKMDNYFQLIDNYLQFQGRKMIIFYEDILTEKESFIQQLYKFVGASRPDKLEYALQHAEELFHTCRQGTNRAWAGNRSNGQLHFHYDRLPALQRQQFETALSQKLSHPQYLFLKEKYSL